MAQHRSSAGYWFIAPACILMIIILFIPVVCAATLSFSNYSLGNTSFNWVGLKNYAQLLNHSSYSKMMIASFTYVIIVVPLSIGLGLGAALLINSLKRFGDLYKTIYFLPVMATLMVMAIVWEFSLHPTIGIVNKTLALGCDTNFETFVSLAWLPWSDGAKNWYASSCENGFPLWFGDKYYTMSAVAFIGIWQGFGFNMVLYLAGLTSVPRELYHAAAMDGAISGWHRFHLVTWPLLGPTTVFVVTITTIRSFQVFDTVEAITRGGPAKSTYVMMYAIYEKGVQQNLIGLGSAITIVFLGFVLFLTLLQRHLIEKKVHYA